jgi:hypothetical protein
MLGVWHAEQFSPKWPLGGVWQLLQSLLFGCANLQFSPAFLWHVPQLAAYARWGRS